MAANERIVAYAGIAQGGHIYSEDSLKLLAQERFDMRYENGKLLERISVDTIPTPVRGQDVTIGFAQEKPAPKKGRAAYRQE